MLTLLGEAVDWIHEGELRERIVGALDGQAVDDPEKQQLRDELEDLRHNLALRAFTAPDADFEDILTSLDARIHAALNPKDPSAVKTLGPFPVSAEDLEDWRVAQERDPS